MTSSNTNPFALPGFGQFKDASQNPMMASLDMMRQAWQNLAGAGAGAFTGGAMVAPPMTLEELDRRINELRSVENWLRMNLSMLSSTIQGMEVQRATIATLKSFVDPIAESSADAPSALEVALGLKPSGQAKIKHVVDPATSKSSVSSSSAGLSGATADAGALPGLPGVGSAEAWWGMLQQQFGQLATATAEGLKSAEQAVAAAGNATQVAAQSVAASASSVSSGLGKAFVAADSAANKPARAAKKAASSAGMASRKTSATAPRAPRKRAASPKTGA